MLIRVVKLTFKSEHISDFLAYFDGIKEQVNTFPGCTGMQLLQDLSDPRIVMTYSHWESEEALEAYRVSETFSTIWPSIKVWFDARPEAWSTSLHFNGFLQK